LAEITRYFCSISIASWVRVGEVRPCVSESALFWDRSWVAEGRQAQAQHAWATHGAHTHTPAA
jgi:hypothetical protein